jgi:large subunit ribosomal protein L5
MYFSSHSTNLDFYYSQIVCVDLVLKQNYSNIHEIPTFQKLVVNTSSASYKADKKTLIPPVFAVELLTGQKPILTCAKKSVASFQIREGEILGCKVTLRKGLLKSFLEILVTVVLPRSREFQGFFINPSQNPHVFSTSVTNLLTFPQLENHFEYFQKFQALNITLFFNKSTPQASRLLLSAFQIPISAA